MSEKTFSSDDLAKHSTAEDLYISIEGKIYDVTNYAQDHPGGADVVLNCAGQDATEGFNDIGHSDDAKQMLKQYLVGKLEASLSEETSRKTDFQVAVPASKKPTKPSSGTRWIVSGIIAILLLILLSNIDIELRL